MVTIVTPPYSSMENKLSNKIDMADVGFIAVVGFITALFIGMGYLIFHTVSMVAFWILLAIFIAGGVAFLIWGMMGNKKNSMGKRNGRYIFPRLKKAFGKKEIELEKTTTTFPYARIEDGYIVMKSGERIATYEVVGKDLSMMSEESIDAMVNFLEQAYRNLNHSIKVIAVDDKYSIDSVIDAGEQRKSEITHENGPEKAYGKLIDQVEKMIKDNITNNANAKHKRYFITICGASVKEIAENRLFFNDLNDGSNTIITRVEDKNTLCMILNHLYLGSENKSKLFSASSKDLINGDEAQDIKFIKDYYKMNNEYHCIMNLTGYPITASSLYMRPLMNFKGVSVVQDIMIVNEQMKKEIINAQKVKMQANASMVMGAYEQMDYQYVIDNINQYIEDMVSGKLRMFLVSTNLILHAPTEEKLKELKQEVKNEIEKNNFAKPNEFPFSQQPAFKNLMNYHLKSGGIFTFNEMSSLAIANMYPYSSMMIKDPLGIFLGMDRANGATVFLDLRTRDTEGKRNNSNVVLVGTSGSGKTYCLSYIALGLTLLGCRMVIFDALNDYLGLTKYLDFKVMDVFKGKDAKINLLQPFDLEGSINDHCTEVIKCLGMVEPERTNVCKVALDKLLKAFYNKGKYFDQDIAKVKDWPTISDLYHFLDKAKPSDIKKMDIKPSEIEPLKDLIYLFTSGIYSDLGNGKTSNSLMGNKLTILDMRGLENIDTAKRDLQMYLVFRLNNAIAGQVAKSNMNKPWHKRTWNVVIADEAHRYINQNNPVARDNFIKFAKEYRHVDGIVINSTQEMSDFAKMGESILKNSTYKFIKKMNSVDFNQYNELLGNTMTDDEKEMLTVQSNRYTMMIDITDVNKTNVELPDLTEIAPIWKNEKSANMN